MDSRQSKQLKKKEKEIIYTIVLIPPPKKTMKPTDSMYQVQDLEEDLLCSKTLLGQEIIAI